MKIYKYNSSDKTKLHEIFDVKMAVGRDESNVFTMLKL